MTNDTIRAVIVVRRTRRLVRRNQLLEERPGAKVTLYTLGHHLGGKATSYRDDDGFSIDHGFHALSTNYQTGCSACWPARGVEKSKILMLDRRYVLLRRSHGKIASRDSCRSAASPDHPEDTLVLQQKRGAGSTKNQRSSNSMTSAGPLGRFTRPGGRTQRRSVSFRFSQDALIQLAPRRCRRNITLKSLRTGWA